MPPFLRSLFSSKPATPAPFIPGHKVIRPKTVAEVLGPAFDYKTGFSARSAFTKKLLKHSADILVVENLLFLLMCEKYKQSPSAAMFNAIYEDFVKPADASNGFDSFSTSYQVNLAAHQLKPIEFARKAWQLGTALSSLSVPLHSTTTFDAASLEIVKLMERDVFPRLCKDTFDTAFTLTTASEKSRYEEAINYLRGYQIILL